MTTANRVVPDRYGVINHGERLDNLETTTDDIILMMADLIGGEKT